MSRLSLVLALTSVCALACNQTGKIAWTDPTSFSVHITCAGATDADCPGGADNAAVCPAPSTPPNLGTPVQPVDRTQRYYQLQVQAIDHNGNPYPGYNGTAHVYAQFEGSVTPTRGAQACTSDQNAFQSGLGCLTLPVKNGQACLTLTLPPAFNQTAIWVEDPSTYSQDPSNPGHRIVSGSFAVGSSEPIYRPSPLIPDIAFTSDAKEQLSGLNNKHVIVLGGSNGQEIVVTSVAATYFTVTDLGTAGDDPNNAYKWGSLDVYTFQEPYGVQVGSVITNLNGQLSNYLGLPELNFPVWTVSGTDLDKVKNLPAHLIQQGDIPNTLSAMAPYKSGLVQIKTDPTQPDAKAWTICGLRGSLLTSYKKYAEWVIAPRNGDCTVWSNSMDVVTKATVPDFDPSGVDANNVPYAGRVICSMKGILSVVVPAANVNLWTITPRSPSDFDTSSKNLVSHASDCPTN